jgi:hypothetical protein
VPTDVIWKVGQTLVQQAVDTIDLLVPLREIRTADRDLSTLAEAVC